MNSTRSGKDPFAEQLEGKQQKKSGRGAKIGLPLLAIVVVVAGAYLGLTKSGRSLTAVVREGVPAMIHVKENPDLLFDHVHSDHVNILLIGRDVNYKEIYKNGRHIWHIPDPTATARADSMIVMSLDRAHHIIRMVSLPRDSKVRMPPNPYHVEFAKLNAAHAYGGPKMLIQAIHDDLGLTIQRYAVIKFDGFKALIDDIGGVEVNVDGALKRDKITHKIYRGNLDYDDNYGNLHIHLKPGLQLLNGQAAHDYVRFREDLEGDPGRMRRQQQVMRALAKKIMQQPVYKIPGLVEEVRKQFLTNMSDDELGSAGYFARSLGDAGKIQPMTLFGSFTSRGMFTLNKSKNIKLMSYVFGDTFDPDMFLRNSPSTEGDEIGPTNNANPATLAVLRAAGVIHSPKDLLKSPSLLVPVRSETDDPYRSEWLRKQDARKRRLASRSTGDDAGAGSASAEAAGAAGAVAAGPEATDSTESAPVHKHRHRRFATADDASSGSNDAASGADDAAPARRQSSDSHGLSVEGN